MSDTFVLADATVVAGEELEVLERASVVVEDGTVRDVVGEAPRGRWPVRSMAGRLLLPAFVNGHTHVDDWPLKEAAVGRPLWEVVMPPDGIRHRRMAALDRPALVAGMREAMRHMLRTGTVAFADFRAHGRAGVEALHEAAAGLPVRPIALGRPASPPPWFSEDELTANAAPLPAGHAREIASVLEVAAGWGVVTAVELTDTALRETGDAVRAAGGILSVHAAEDDGYRRLSTARTGRSDVERIVEHLRPDVTVHLTATTPEELDLVASSGTTAVVCFQTHAVLGTGFPPLRALLDRGVPVCLGTDNAMLTSPDLLREVGFVARAVSACTGRPAAVPPRELLAMVTVVPARAFRLDRELGAIAVGRRASFVALDLASPNLAGSTDLLASVVLRADAGDIAAVVVDGRLAHGSWDR